MENPISKDIVKNNGDLGREQLGANASKVATEQPGVRETRWEPKGALLAAQSSLGIEKPVSMYVLG